MKLACQESRTPGATFAAKLANLERWGYEGVELDGRGLRDRVAEVRSALEASAIRASTICSGFTPMLIHPDRAARERCVAEMKALMRIGADLGVVGLIFVPMFGPPQVPDLSPVHTPHELERLLLVNVVKRELAPYAEDLGILLLLEPLNRYEAHIPKDLEEGAQICEEIGSPQVRLMADLFHMNVEEADIASSLIAAAAYIRHVHLADSNRLPPGFGHTDFARPLAALKSVGYDGYMALECRVPEPAEESLAKAAEFIHGLI